MGVLGEIGDGFKYLLDQAYAGLETIDYGIMWQFAKAGYLGDDPAEIESFTKRFHQQWYNSTSKLISSLGKINPLYKVIEIITKEYVRRNSEQTLILTVKTYYGISIKGLTARTVIQLLFTKILTSVLAKESIRKLVSGSSLILGLVATEQGMELLSYQDARDLKVVKPHLYSLLYQGNVETFYFLVAKNLNPFTKGL